MRQVRLQAQPTLRSHSGEPPSQRYAHSTRIYGPIVGLAGDHCIPGPGSTVVPSEFPTNQRRKLSCAPIPPNGRSAPCGRKPPTNLVCFSKGTWGFAGWPLAPAHQSPGPSIANHLPTNQTQTPQSNKNPASHQPAAPVPPIDPSPPTCYHPSLVTPITR